MGLSIDYEVERFGIDLHVMDEILGASHPNIDDAMIHFVAGYEQCEGKWASFNYLEACLLPQSVINRLEEVES